MYNRIVAFGCSYVAGDAMPDVWEKNKRNKLKKIKKGKSLITFPGLIATELGLKFVNNGISGASNKEILEAIENFEFDKDDVVILHWSFVNRTLFRTLDNNTIQILPSTNPANWGPVLAKKYYDFQNDMNMLSDTRIFVNYANYRLKFLGVRNIINFSPILGEDARKKITNNIYDFPVDTKHLTYFANTGQYPDRDLALDQKHPGPETHKRFAEYILEEYPWLKE